ncbi:hypothetical protein BTO16_16225 [Polaribacter glomeratus]|uniref:Uncharacterized protein n=1 Tax=Polaribacter glomeratus TaxID=102 RepID=A0A2S7WIW1_9FLAO|nr:hypothetical protein BTO16_16225 [Polaribacter glomeratus]
MQENPLEPLNSFIIGLLFNFCFETDLHFGQAFINFNVLKEAYNILKTFNRAQIIIFINQNKNQF